MLDKSVSQKLTAFAVLCGILLTVNLLVWFGGYLLINAETYQLMTVEVTAIKFLALMLLALTTVAMVCNYVITSYLRSFPTPQQVVEGELSDLVLLDYESAKKYIHAKLHTAILLGKREDVHIDWDLIPVNFRSRLVLELKGQGWEFSEQDKSYHTIWVPGELTEVIYKRKAKLA